MALKTVIANSKTKSLSSNHLECRVCKQRFYTTGNLIDHMSTHKHFLLHCNICNKGFSDQKNLDEHYLTHKEVTNTFDCSQCEKKFLQKYQLEYHMQFHAILTPVSRTGPQKKKSLSFTSFQDSSNSESEVALDADTSEDYKPPTKKVKSPRSGRKVKAKNRYDTDEEISESEEFASDDSRYDYMLPQKTKSGRTVKRKKFFGSEPKTKRRRKDCEEYPDSEENDTTPGYKKTSKKQTVKRREKAADAKFSPTTPVHNDMPVSNLLEKKKSDQIAHKNYLLSKKQAKNKCMKFIDGNFSAENERTLIGFKKKIDSGERNKRKYNTKKSKEKEFALSAKHLETSFKRGSSLKSTVKRRLIDEAFLRYGQKLQQTSNCDQEEMPNKPETVTNIPMPNTPETITNIPMQNTSETIPNIPVPNTNSPQSSLNFNLKKLSVVLEKIPETVYSKYAEKIIINSDDMNDKQTANQNKTLATALKEKTDYRDISKNISNQCKMPESSIHDETPDTEFNIPANNLKDSGKFNLDSSKNAACVSKTNEAKNTTNNNQVKYPEISDLPLNTKAVPVNISVNAKTVLVNKLVSPKAVPVTKPLSVKTVAIDKPVSANQIQNLKPPTKVSKPELKSTPTTQIAINVINPSGIDREFLYVGPEQDYNKITSVINEMESMSSNKNTAGALLSKSLQTPRNTQNVISSSVVCPTNRSPLSNDKIANLSQNCEQGVLEKKFIKDFVFVKVTREYMEKIQQEKSDLLVKHGSIEPSTYNTTHTVKPANNSANLSQVKPAKEILPFKLTEKVVEQNTKPGGLSSQSAGTDEKSRTSHSKSSSAFGSSNASSEANNAKSLQTSHVKNVVVVNTVLGNESRFHKTADSFKNCKTDETDNRTINSKINESPIQKKPQQPKRIEFDKAKSISIDKDGNSVTHFLKVLSPKKKSVDKNNETTICRSSKIPPELSQMSVKSKAVSANVQIKNYMKDFQLKPCKVTITNLNTGVEQSLEQMRTEMKTNTESAKERKSKEFQHVIIDRAKALCLENKTVVSDSPNSKQTYLLKKSTNKDTEAKLKNSPKNKIVSELSQKVSKANNLCEATTSPNSKLLAKNTEANSKNSPTNKSTVKNIEAKPKDCRRSKPGPESSPKASAIDNSKETIKTSVETNVKLKESESVLAKKVASSKTNEEPGDELGMESEDLQSEKDAKIESNSSQVVSPILSEKVLQRYKEKMAEKERKKREKYELKKKLRMEGKFANSPDKTCPVGEESEKLTVSKDETHSSKSEEACTVDENKKSNKNHKKNSKSNYSQLTVDVSQNAVEENSENSNSVTKKASSSKDTLKSDTSNGVMKQPSKVKVTYAIRFSPKSQAQHEKLKSKPCKSSDEEAIEKAYEISLRFQKSLSEKECLEHLDELDSLITNFNISKKCPFLFTIIRFCRLYIDSYKVKEQAISLHTKLTKDLL